MLEEFTVSFLNGYSSFKILKKFTTLSPEHLL
ncbi:MAG: hypothetical protein ACI9QC_000685, partial [Oceanicoccus sp.]